MPVLTFFYKASNMLFRSIQVLPRVTDGMIMDLRGYYKLDEGHHHCCSVTGAVNTLFVRMGRIVGGCVLLKDTEMAPTRFEPATFKSGDSPAPGLYYLRPQRGWNLINELADEKSNLDIYTRIIAFLLHAHRDEVRHSASHWLPVEYPSQCVSIWRYTRMQQWFETDSSVLWRDN